MAAHGAAELAARAGPPGTADAADRGREVRRWAPRRTATGHGGLVPNADGMMIGLPGAEGPSGSGSGVSRGRGDPSRCSGRPRAGAADDADTAHGARDGDTGTRVPADRRCTRWAVTTSDLSSRAAAPPAAPSHRPHRSRRERRRGRLPFRSPRARGRAGRVAGGADRHRGGRPGVRRAGAAGRTERGRRGRWPCSSSRRAGPWRPCRCRGARATSGCRWWCAGAPGVAPAAACGGWARSPASAAARRLARHGRGARPHGAHAHRGAVAPRAGASRCWARTSRTAAWGRGPPSCRRWPARVP